VRLVTDRLSRQHSGKPGVMLRFTFSFTFPFTYTYLINYPLCSTPLTDLSDIINSTPQLLFYYFIHFLLHTPTCSPPIPSVVFCLTTHRPSLTLVDLPSSLYFINCLIVRISPKLILLCTLLSHLGSAYPVNSLQLSVKSILSVFLCLSSLKALVSEPSSSSRSQTQASS